jgi:hypothetical protein
MAWRRTCEVVVSRVGFEAARHATQTASRLSWPTFFQAGGRPQVAAPPVQMKAERMPPWDPRADSDSSGRLDAVRAIPRLPWTEITVSPQEQASWRQLIFPPAGDPIFDGYLAQAVLNLDPNDAAYLSGRRRQTLRTNLRHAQARGIKAIRLPSYVDWFPVAREMLTLREWGQNSLDRMSAPGPTQDMGYFAAVDRGDRIVGETAVAIFGGTAVLFSALSRQGHPGSAESRYLLHTFMRSELRAQGIRTIVAGSVLRTRPGTRYFQHLVGYDVRNLAFTVAGGDRG